MMDRFYKDNNINNIKTIDKKIIRVLDEGRAVYPNIIKEGLVMWYDFRGKTNYDNIKNVAYDYSGNGNHGQLMNFGYTEDSGWVDGGLKFNGVDDAIKNSPIVLDKSFTLSVVFKYNSKEVETSVIFNLPVASSLGWNIALGFAQRYSKDSAQAVLIYKREDGSITTYISPSIALVDGEKYTLSTRFDYNTKTIFFIKDNQIVSSDTLTEFSEHVKNRGIGMGWGNNGPAKRQHILYDIKLYNRALTDEEILQNYQAEQKLRHNRIIICNT